MTIMMMMMIIGPETVRNKSSALTPGVAVSPDLRESQFVPNLVSKRIKRLRRRSHDDNGQEPDDFHASEEDKGCQRKDQT